MIDDILKNYKTILASDISTICKPLEDFGITFFHYVRRFPDSSRINISNKPEWIEQLYTDNLYLGGALDWNNKYYQTSYFLWSTLTTQKIYIYAREKFDVDHGITLIKKLPDNSVEFAHFGAKKADGHVINFYLANIDFLNRFVLYFKEQADTLINKAIQNKIIVPIYNRKVNQQDLKIITQGHIENLWERHRDFLCKTKIKKYQMETQYGPVKLTNRELDCLIGFLEGKTASEIADTVFRSKRTIEKHLEHIRQKLCCNTKAELIAKLMDKGFVFHDKIWRVFT
jgi:DNA-binding CsgD family transcriptional regulator